MDENYFQALICCAMWVAETPKFVIKRHVVFCLLLYANVISSVVLEFVSLDSLFET